MQASRADITAQMILIWRYIDFRKLDLIHSNRSQPYSLFVRADESSCFNLTKINHRSEACPAAHLLHTACDQAAFLIPDSLHNQAPALTRPRTLHLRAHPFICLDLPWTMKVDGMIQADHHAYLRTRILRSTLADYSVFHLSDMSKVAQLRVHMLRKAVESVRTAYGADEPII